jgi:hypothetical protein
LPAGMREVLEILSSPELLVRFLASDFMADPASLFS